MIRSLGCMRLNTAGVIIGWMSATISVISIIVFALGLNHLPYLTQSVKMHMHENGIDENCVKTGLKIVLWIYITLNLLNLIASTLLVMGTILERHLMLLPWLIYNGISMCGAFVYFIYYMFNAKCNHIPTITLVTSGTSVVVLILWWYLIYLLYKQLQEDREVKLCMSSDITIYTAC